MSVPPQSIIDTRRHQMFPVLEPAEAERVRRFGKVRSYGVGDMSVVYPLALEVIQTVR